MMLSDILLTSSTNYVSAPIVSPLSGRIILSRIKRSFRRRASGSNRPNHEPASREDARCKAGAFGGGTARLSGIWSAFEHEGSPFSSRQGEDQMTIQSTPTPVTPLRRRVLEDMPRSGPVRVAPGQKDN